MQASYFFKVVFVINSSHQLDGSRSCHFNQLDFFKHKCLLDIGQYDLFRFCGREGFRHDGESWKISAKRLTQAILG